jgi:hypothetical protein
MYTCNPSTQEAEAVGLQVQGQSGLHIKILSWRGRGNEHITISRITATKKNEKGDSPTGNTCIARQTIKNVMPVNLKF